MRPKNLIPISWESISFAQIYPFHLYESDGKLFLKGNNSIASLENNPPQELYISKQQHLTYLRFCKQLCKTEEETPDKNAKDFFSKPKENLFIEKIKKVTQKNKLQKNIIALLKDDKRDECLKQIYPLVQILTPSLSKEFREAHIFTSQFIVLLFYYMGEKTTHLKKLIREKKITLTQINTLSKKIESDLLASGVNLPDIFSRLLSSSFYLWMNDAPKEDITYLSLATYLALEGNGLQLVENQEILLPEEIKDKLNLLEDIDKILNIDILVKNAA